jgi:hypothetical protein
MGLSENWCWFSADSHDCCAPKKIFGLEKVVLSGSSLGDFLGVFGHRDD